MISDAGTVLWARTEQEAEGRRAHRGAFKKRGVSSSNLQNEVSGSDRLTVRRRGINAHSDMQVCAARRLFWRFI